jgi:hypothetical protein
MRQSASLARVGLRQRVEGRDAYGREREQEAIRPAVDDERVTERGTRRRRGDGIGNEDIPRQAHAACDGRHRIDHRTFHAAELGSFRRPARPRLGTVAHDRHHRAVADGSEISTHALVTGMEVLRPAPNVIIVTVVEEADPTLVTGTGFASGTMSPGVRRMQVERNARRSTSSPTRSPRSVSRMPTPESLPAPGEAVCVRDRSRRAAIVIGTRPRRIQAGVARFGLRLRGPQRAVPGSLTGEPARPDPTDRARVTGCGCARDRAEESQPPVGTSRAPSRESA